jgi:hypothetical protein
MRQLQWASRAIGNVLLAIAQISAMVVLVVLLSAALGSLSGFLGPRSVLELIAVLVILIALLIYRHTLASARH